MIRQWRTRFERECGKFVFGLWLLVFGLINYNDRIILPKTKDQQLKTETVFGLWLLVFGSFLRRVSPTFSVGGPCGMNENYHSTDFTDKKVIDHCQWSLAISLWFDLL